jgi:hypothetical protein
MDFAKTWNFKSALGNNDPTHYPLSILQGDSWRTWRLLSSNFDDMKEDFALITSHFCEGTENKPDLNLSCVV